ncbi:MAG: hypothetical protein JXB62_10245, partial [Pirellulales bacterium]|nr:hypothetical protein [Pirellulales bacterium]
DAIGGERLTKRVLRRVSRSLADHYKQRITAKRPENRLKQFTELLCSEGVLADTGQQKGKVVLRKRSCPFIGMLDENHMICAVGLEMIAQIVGSRVRRTACRYEGDPCCVFEIVDKR